MIWIKHIKKNKKKKRRTLKYYLSKRGRIILKNKMKNLIQYLKVRHLIRIKQKYLILMILFSGATVAATSIDKYKHNLGIIFACFIGMIYFFVSYIKVKKFYSNYKIYDLYEVKVSTGTIHMRIIDLYRRFIGKSEKEIKQLLIDCSYKDFMEIIKNYKEMGSGSRIIQTHKTLIRPFMKALRDSGIVNYEDTDLENYLTEVAECDGIDFTECFLSEYNGYRVQLKYIGCIQNKMIALRYPITKLNKKRLNHFSIVIPYYEVTVNKCKK